MVVTEVQRVAGIMPRRPQFLHAENPDRLGWALCGRRLSPVCLGLAEARPRCVVCVDLTRRTYLDR